MPRQRIRATSSPVELVGRLVLVLVCLAVLWYGLMLVLLALGASPSTVNLISGYRAVYDVLSGLGPESLDGTSRLIVAVAGLVGMLFFGFLAFKELPRPRIARRRLDIASDERGSIGVEPRAIERVGEGAALANASVSAAAGRYEGDEMIVNVHLTSPRGVPDALRDVQRKTAEALGRHELPPVPVGVVMIGFDQPQQTQRELN